jgi:hypothetical protein
MVVLGVENEQALKDWIIKLSSLQIQTEAFIEPDKNNEITAVSVAPTDKKKIFKKLRLL